MWNPLTGVPQSSRSSRSSALILDNHLDVLHYHLLSTETSSAFRVDLSANRSLTTFTNTDVQYELLLLDSSHRILGRILDSQTHPSPFLEQSNHYFCLLLALLFLSWVLGSHPWLFFVHHVHQARVSSNLPLAFWLTASLAVLSQVSGHTSRDSAFPRAPLTACSVAGSSFTPILGFGSRVSLALVCFFSPDCEFLVVIVHLVLLCARLLFWSWHAGGHSSTAV